jgi:hypothetical protein
MGPREGAGQGDFDLPYFSVDLGESTASRQWFDVASSYTASPSNAWHYNFSVWTKGQFLKIYVDGTLEGTLDISSAGALSLFDPSVSAPQISHAFTIGGSPSAVSLSSQYRGAIDDLRVYNRALSAYEIQYIYTRQRHFLG